MQEEFILLLPGLYLEGLQIYSLTYAHSRPYLNVHRNKTKLKLYTSLSGFSFIYCNIWQFVTLSINARAWVGGIMPTHSLCKFSAMSLDSLTFFNHHKKWGFSFKFFFLICLPLTPQYRHNYRWLSCELKEWFIWQRLTAIPLSSLGVKLVFL